MDEATVLISMTVNGRRVDVAAKAHHTLLEVLRYQLDLIGSKQGCDKGDCGACTVQLDGEPILACLTLASDAHGRVVKTVEGLAGQSLGKGHPAASAVHPLQDAFERHGAAQCGFCTPGILMTADALMQKAGRPLTRDQVKAGLAGNLCRCTGYTKILDAVVEASGGPSPASRDSAGGRAS